MELVEDTYTTKSLNRPSSPTSMSALSPENLAELLRRVAHDRDQSAYAALFKHFAPKVKSYGLRHLRADGQALELVQETMLLVWRKAHLYNGEKGAASTWIFTIMRNVSFDMLRKVKSNREDCLSGDIWPLIEGESGDQEEDALHDQLQAQLFSYIDLLPDLQKQVVQGVYIKQLTHQELADQLNVPLGTIKSRLRLGLQKLRTHLEVNDD
ncbi:RNA polymerase subunit sigma [Enterovibrio norvegicus FF-33]|uniref:RNA polymerase sigma factor n=1 Tax=Enterovibrio norvegicus FF-454 TaxID=1185651 RepID=A0A1E5C198_9GAMM|nr:sigma-70 family RNA polymerase sigma factor [Enterovibrio norvegicus]OEE59259.1 RNA polymerase subunit sigma [Enterovibrio norvegicus FF-454]OEE67626.1 RNA polymerase subunit sigma [Enterovibrio norvegicus FF-33]OEE87007.1 RNA polymerase subunit sigma [Enterovibrio norvegicus FF-162]